MRVLVVEDEVLVSIMLADFLIELGHEIAAVESTVSAALAQLTDHPPELVLLDLRLEGEMGYPVAELCRERQIPLVLTTGVDPAMLPASMGGFVLVEKPFSLGTLRDAVLRATQSG